MARQVLGVDVSRLRSVPTNLTIQDRASATKWLTLQVGTINRMMPELTRLVADLPTDTTPEVVWTSGSSELLVHTDQASVTASSGVLQIGILVDCDEIKEPATVTVAFAAGTSEEPRGLFLATFEQPSGPPPVVSIWADALTAFAWESVVTLATHLAAASGNDSRGRPLIPGSIAAGQGVLQVLPMPKAAGR